MYDELAGFYDNAIRDRFSEVMALRVRRVLKELGLPPPGTVLDLGCGSGLLAIALAKAGYRVIGMDRSERMLDIARRRAEQASVPLQLMVGDIRDFRLDDRVDAAVCTGDVVNHLLETEDLADLFGCVRDALFPRGPFLFDVNTLAMYRSRLWQTEDSTVEADHFTMRTTARFDEVSGIGRLDTQVLERTMLTERDRRGSLRQRYWPDDVLKAQVEEAGFRVLAVETFHPLDLPKELPELVGTKAFWTCRRA